MARTCAWAASGGALGSSIHGTASEQQAQGSGAGTLKRDPQEAERSSWQEGRRVPQAQPRGPRAQSPGKHRTFPTETPELVLPWTKVGSGNKSKRREAPPARREGGDCAAQGNTRSEERRNPGCLRAASKPVRLSLRRQPRPLRSGLSERTQIARRRSPERPEDEGNQASGGEVEGGGRGRPQEDTH